MISTSRSGSKRVAASESDPNAARPHPSRDWTFDSSLACCTARNDEQIGLNRYSSTSAVYWSKMQFPVPRLVASTPLVVQSFQQRQQLVEILEPDDVAFAQLGGDAAVSTSGKVSMRH